MFLSFLLRGLSFPAHEFLCGLLFVYGVQLHQLTPNSILHIACFVTLCESFLGIEPHFLLWRSIFRLCPSVSLANKPELGGAVVSVRPGALLAIPLSIGVVELSQRCDHPGCTHAITL
jgi:hypothetical protein